MEANRIKTNRISVVHIGHIRDTETLDAYYRLVSEGKRLVNEERVLVTRKKVTTNKEKENAKS